MKRYLTDAAMWAVVLLAPIKPVLLTVGFLMVADLITGVWGAYKNGEKITSFKLRQSPTKCATYLIAIICGFLMEKYILGGDIPVVKVVAGMISSTELLSIYENLNKISGVDLVIKVKDLLQPPKQPPTV